jgi:phosphoserine phosphatase
MESYEYIKPSQSSWKVAYIEDYCSGKNIGMSEVFHVGDSRSDIPLFNTAGFSIAFNADVAARSAASVSIESNSLLDILSIIPGLKS